MTHDMSFIPDHAENHSLGWALYFAGLGQRVFPIWGVDHDTGVDLKTGDEATRLANSGKTPMVPWTEWATIDREKILEWDRTTGHGICNWGVALGEGMIVVDCDSEDAVDWFEHLWGQDNTGPTLVSRTARGEHWYFWGDSRTYKPHPEIDVKGRGGYVVLPGSVTWNASVTYVLNPQARVADAPSWVGSEERERATGDTEGELRFSEGGRNNALISMMGAMRRLGFGDAQMHELLPSLNQMLCDPPLSDEELEDTIERSLSRWPRGTEIDDMVAVAAMFGDTVSLGKKFMTDNDRRFRPPPTWTYEGVIPGTGIGQFYGGTGSGKTFILVDLMLRFCNEMNWGWFAPTYRSGSAPDGSSEARDHVLYVMGEGVFDINERINAWKLKNDGSASKLITVEEQGYDLSKLQGWTQLFTDMENDQHMVSVRHRLGMVVLDTQSLMLLGAKENDNTEMNIAMQAAKAASRYLGCPVIFVHHQGRMGDNDRGASSVKAAMDFQIRVSGDVREQVEVEFTKIKAAAIPDPHLLTFVMIDSGTSLVASCDAEDIARITAQRNLNDPIIDEVLAFLADGPRTFADILRQVGIPGNAYERRNILTEKMLARGLYETGETIRNSRVWDIGQTA